MRCYRLAVSVLFFFFFSSRRRHTRCSRDWSSDVCSSDLPNVMQTEAEMLMNTCWFNCMGMDDATGVLSLDGDDLQLNFTGAIAKHPTFLEEAFRLLERGKAGDGTYRIVPQWHDLAPV